LQCYQPSTQEQCLNITKTGACNLGDSCGGGVVSCLGGAPYLNLVAATTFPNTIIWGAAPLTTGATSLIDGASNTAKIISTPLETVPNAATTCQAYSGGGYNDWYLPAKDQLTCLLNNIFTGKISGQTNTVFWTSTEISDTLAWGGVIFAAVIQFQQYGKPNNFWTPWCVRNL